MDVTAYLTEQSGIIERAMQELAVVPRHTPQRLREAMEYSLFSAGKRIRPALAIAACDAAGGDRTLVLPFACAIEMIHTYSLIHDDLPSLDNDDLRRGKPTCHKVFDEATAVLAGDALLTEAFRVMADPGLTRGASPAKIRKIIWEIAKAAGADGMVGGQAVDVLYDGKKGSKRILGYIHTHKTAALITVSVVTGALTGGAKGGHLKRFKEYGESIGLAFQIMDDLLDVTGDEGKVGKKLRKDESKQTYIMHYGIEASRKKISALVAKAVCSLGFLGERKQTLVSLAEFIGNRVS